MLTVHEGVEDGHGAVGDTGIWVHLLEDCKKRRVSNDSDQEAQLMKQSSSCDWFASDCDGWRTLVDVRAVGLLPGLGALLLLARGGGSLLACLLLLGGSLASWCLTGGGWGL